MREKPTTEPEKGEAEHEAMVVIAGTPVPTSQASEYRSIL